MRKRKTVPLVCLLTTIAALLLLFASHSLVYTNSEPVKRTLKRANFQTVKLIINEYLADPPGTMASDTSGDTNGDGVRDSTDDEFIELVNDGPAPLNIAGFTISDSVRSRFTFPPGAVIPAGEAAVVFGGGSPRGAFGNAAANHLVFTAGAGLALNNTSVDSIIIKDNNGIEIARRDYPDDDGRAKQSITRSPDVTGGFTKHVAAAGSEGALFSPGTLVNGRPFVTTDPIISSISPASIIAGNSPVVVTVTGRNFKNGSRVRVGGLHVNTAFTSATELNADIPASLTLSQGAHPLAVENPDGVISNSVSFTIIGSVGINEFLADPPDAIAGDANGDGTRESSQDEFIEIVNRSNAAVIIGGFSISDAAQVRFTFPPNLSLPAGEAAIVFGGGSPRGEFGNAALNGLVFTAPLSLNNSGDVIALKDAAGNLLESISYGSSEGNANQSLNRNPDIAGASFAPHSTITDSGARLFSPGTRADGLPFTPGPRITSITPDRAPFESAPLSISISGSGFEHGSTVFIDGSPTSTSFVSDGALAATVPVRVMSAAGDHEVEVRNENGNRSNVVSFTIIPPGPFLRSLQPALVQIGTSPVRITLIGANFDSRATVLIDALAITTVFINTRELSATLPTTIVAAPGMHSLRVRNGDGRLSNELPFDVVLPRPRITSLKPQQALADGTDFGLSIAGANFKNGATVMFDQTTVATKFISSSELEAQVPASMIKDAGLRAVTVVNIDGAISNETVFRVIAMAPLISSINPSDVPQGANDLTITFTGENFQQGAIVRVMEELTPGLTLETVFISDDRLEARLPAEFMELASKVLLRVENPDFGVSNTVAFNVFIKDPLVINEFLADPADGLAGDANQDGSRNAAQDEFVEIVNRTSEPLDISGYKLFDSEVVRHVFPHQSVIPPFEAAIVFGGGTPAGQFGNAAENRLVFKATSGGLSLNNGGDTIRLEDSASRIVQEIKFDATQGNAKQSLNREPDISGAVFLPHTFVAADGGRLFSPGTKATGERFTIKPRIIAITPASVRRATATFTIIVSGSSFIEGALVLFDKTPLQTSYRSGSEIEAEVSSHLIVEGGAVEVRVRNPKGELSESFKFLITDDPPRIVSITPQQTGTGADDFEITVAGDRFQPGAILTLAGESVATRLVAPSILIATIPQRFFTRAGELEVRVVNADGNRSNVVHFKIENGPLITRLQRARLKAGRGAVEITVGGLAFNPGVILFVNDQAILTSFRSDTALTGRIPEGFTARPGTLTIQARNPDGGRSNKVTLKVVE